MGDARCAAATMLAAVTAGLSVVREPRLVRERFEHQLRHLTRARSVVFRDDQEPPAVGAGLVTVPILGAPGGRARIEAVFDPGRPPDAYARRMLVAAAQVAGLLLEIERAHGRWPLACATSRGDGAAPLIGSSPEICLLRERLERVATTDFTILIEGGFGPQPHPDFVDVFGSDAVGGGDGALAGGEKSAQRVGDPAALPRFVPG